MRRDKGEPSTLSFSLDVVDEWPPVSIEVLPVERQGATNGYRLLVAPLFVKSLAVDDLIKIEEQDDAGAVVRWSHIALSERSTMWLMKLKASAAVEATLQALRELGCNTVSSELGIYSIDIPGNVPLQSVDVVLDGIDPDEVAVAFPALRHQE